MPGFEPELTDGELVFYKAVFATIEREYRQIEKLKQQLDRLAKVRWEQADPKPFRAIETPGGRRWDACAILLDLQSLRGSQIPLCRRPKVMNGRSPNA
jgi:hypothetical protein